MALSSCELSALACGGLLKGLVALPPFVATLGDPALHQRHGRGQTVLAKGAAPEGMFIVVHGILELVLSNARGVEHVVRLARAGHCVGLENALGETPAAYALRALTEASLIFVPRATLGAWIEASPIFSRRLMHLLADDVADLYEELEGLQNRSTLDAHVRGSWVVHELEEARVPQLVARSLIAGLDLEVDGLPVGVEQTDRRVARTAAMLIETPA